MLKLNFVFMLSRKKAGNVKFIVNLTRVLPHIIVHIIYKEICLIINSALDFSDVNCKTARKVRNVEFGRSFYWLLSNHSSLIRISSRVAQRTSDE